MESATGSTIAFSSAVPNADYVLSRTKYGNISKCSKEDAIDIMCKYHDNQSLIIRMRKLQRQDPLTEVACLELLR